MSVNDNTPVNAANTNAAFLSRKEDSDTVGKIDLKDSGSANVIDVQQVINDNIGDISQNATDIDTNTTNISNNDTDISNLDTRVGDNETDIITINNTLPLKADLVGGKIPTSQLPTSAMEYLGNWNASTNTPTLIDGTGDNGDVYRVSVAGSQDLGSGSISFAVGDWVIYNGTVWEKSLNSSEVISVNSKTGVIVLDADDIAESTTKFWDLKNNRDATVDPTINDDSGDNYAIGSTWFNKTTGILYVLQDASVGAAVWIVASGSGGGGSLDFFYTENFETTVAADLTVTGTWTRADNTTTPISGDSSIKMTQASGSDGAQVTAGNIALDLNQKDTTISLQGRYLYDGNNNEIDFVIYDVANSKVLSRTLLPASDAAKTFRVLANTLSTTANIKWYFEVMTENIGAILEFDNIEGRINPLPTVESIEVNSVMLEGNDARAITANTEDVHFSGSGNGWTSVGDTHFYTVQDTNSVIEINAAVAVTVSGSLGLLLYKNGALYKRIDNRASTTLFSGGYISKEGEFGLDDTLSIRISLSKTIGGSTSTHYLNIVETAISANVVFEGKTSAFDTNAYTPVTEGFGTLSSADFTWRITGDNLFIQGRLVAGTTSATEARLYLPTGYTVKNIITQPTSAGTFSRASTGPANQMNVIIDGSESYIKLSTNMEAGNPLIPANGNAVLATGEGGSFFATVPVNELKASDIIYSVPVTNEVENDFAGTINPASGGTWSSRLGGVITSVSRSTATVTINLSPGFMDGTQTVVATQGGLNQNTIQPRNMTITSSSITFVQRNDAGADIAIDLPWNIIISRGDDYKAPKGYFLGNMPLTRTAYIDPHATLSKESVAGSTSYKTMALDHFGQNSNSEFISIASNQATIKPGRYELGIPVGAYNGTGWLDLLVYNFSGTSNYEEFLDVLHSSTDDGSFDTVNMTIDISEETIFEFKTKSSVAAGTEYWGRIKISQILAY